VSGQIKYLIKVEESRRDSKWMEVIKWIHILLSIMDISARGRIICLVKCHAQLGLKCSNQKEEEACRQMLQGVEISRSNLCAKLAKSWPFVNDLFAKHLHYSGVDELLKVIHMCLICKDLVHTDLKMPFSAVEKLIKIERLGDTWRSEFFVDDQHTTRKTRETMSMFVYGGSLTKGDCRFEFGGLSMAELEIRYQAKKETDFEKLELEQELKKKDKMKQSMLKREQKETLKKCQRKDNKLLFGLSTKDLEKVYRAAKADEQPEKMSTAVMREKYLGISSMSKPQFK